MYLRITGFLRDDSEDSSLKYELSIATELEPKVMDILDWKSLSAESDGILPLMDEQVRLIAEAIETPLPEDLDMFIGVYK